MTIVGRSSFPNTYHAVPLATLLTAYREGPARMRAVTRWLDLEALRARPIPDKWSILEIAVHVADSELVGAARFRLAFAQSGAPLPGYDQDVWARAFAYQDGDQQTLEQALQLLDLLRRTTRPLLEELGGDDWKRWGTHPEHGRVTLCHLLELYADHTERHVAQILERRRLLGMPLEMRLLLPERLY